MRIIAGEWGGRSIRVPRDARVRPTADRAREAWMSIVQPELPGARVLDLFAGSGALGLEALSRGAASADFVEIALPSLKALRDNIAALGAEAKAHVHRADALRYVNHLEPGAYDVAFADPPYKLGMAQRLTSLWLRRPFAAILGVEHDAHETLPEGGDTRLYGSTAITLFRA
ncbi:MAG TPA: 16S rRNA (guanine(966)-N(2))-methyltransferase RsmD [Gemmatimonadaceae bacterium]|nr:16S rRNA (guanine(966)-N(2))-methyltransferase RsmD [Gemmatimonadaceae bacterium]